MKGVKVLVVSTADIVGGAAVATFRLVCALRAAGVEAVLLVRDKRSSAPFVYALPHRRRARVAFLVDRLLTFAALLFRRRHLWAVDFNACGSALVSHPLFVAADVVHLAWINQGFLSLSTLRQIVASGKRIVWTLHDAWPLVAVCHYPRRCEQYVAACPSCPLLPTVSRRFSALCAQTKRAIYAAADIQFVACSEWLAGMARGSMLTRESTIRTIPNAVDMSLFAPRDKTAARAALSLNVGERHVILFLAQNVRDPRKGAPLFLAALHRLVVSAPAVAAESAVVFVGGESKSLAAQCPLPAVAAGYVSGDEYLAQVYGAADVFVSATSDDNLPNTIMEALASGVPVVASAVGGIPEMLRHKENGYLAAPGDSSALADGIAWVLTHRGAELSARAVAFCRDHYSPAVVAEQYRAVYEGLT